jgi:hypothetical protein
MGTIASSHEFTKQCGRKRFPTGGDIAPHFEYKLCRRPLRTASPFLVHQWLERGAISRAATGDDIFFLKPASGKFLSDCADHRADTPSRETVLDKVPPAPALIDDFLDLFASGT